MPKILVVEDSSDAYQLINRTLSGSNQIDFAEAAAKSPASDYIPANMKAMIVAATRLIENGQSAEVTFTVPAKAGNYPYLCTFPGHMAAGARGKLIVK